MFSLVESAEGVGKSLSIFYEDGGTAVVPSTHSNFDELIELLMSGQADDESVRNLANTLYSVGQKLSRLSERVTVTDSNVLFDGDPLRGELADVIFDSFSVDGLDSDSLKPLVNFLEKAKTNPSVRSIDDLYRWAVRGGLTITPNGDFVAYKGVAVDPGGNSKSISRGSATVNGVQHTGQIPNPDGAIVEMPRSEVDPDSSSYCSVGLHVGTYRYAHGFAQGRTLLCQINPRDVVSVPEDCNSQKVRVSRYVVLNHIDQELYESVYSGTYAQDEYDEDEIDDEEYEDEYECDECGATFCEGECALTCELCGETYCEEECEYDEDEDEDEYLEEGEEIGITIRLAEGQGEGLSVDQSYWDEIFNRSRRNQNFQGGFFQ